MKNVSLKTQINQTKGYVYYYRIPSVFTFEKIIPYERQSEIDLTNNQENKSEKYFVWRLLEWVFLNVYQKKMEDITFKKEKNGKWFCDFCSFSLTHRKGFVAIALSSDPIGVDVEKINVPVKNFDEKILTKKERDSLNLLSKKEKDKALILKWSLKESIYKMDNAVGVSFKRIDTGDYFTKYLFFENDQYVLTAATKIKKEIEFIEINSLI